MIQTQSRLNVVGAACAVLFGAAGCASRTPPPVWVAPEQAHWSDLVDVPIEPIHNAYALLIDEPTRGQFPASMAVSRISIGIDDGTQERTAFIARKPRNEFLSWNEAFDDQMAISEVFPVWQRDLGGAKARPAQIVAAFRALHGNLGLVYAVNRKTEHRAEMLGILYATADQTPLAAIHATAESILPDEGKEASSDPNLWESDARPRVRRKFERLVHECVRKLIEQDQPQIVDVPEGWTPALPIRPVEWPPRPSRRQR